MSYKEVKLHKYQSMAFNSDARFIALTAGVGGGKTYYGPIWMYREISRYPNDIWMVISPTYKVLSRATMRAFLTFFEGTDLEGTLNKTDKEYHLPDGGKVYFCSAEKPDFLEGGQFRGVWLDEAGAMKRWAWVVTQARLSVKLGRALLTSTPRGKNWFYWDFHKRWEDGDPDYLSIQFDSVENPQFPREEFERMKRILSPAEFAMRYRGQFTELEGLVFPNYANCLTEDSIKYPDATDTRVGGIDFGWTAPSAALTAYLDTVTGKWVIYREFYEVHCLMGKMAESLDHQATYYADPSFPKEIEELRSHGISVEPADNSYLPGIRKVNEYITDGKILASRNICPNLVDEISGFTDQDGSDRKNKSKPNHLIDCLRYMVMGIDAGVTPINIYML